MKSTDQELFSLHQRRCVKCRWLKELRDDPLCPPPYPPILRIHEENMMLLYGRLTLLEWLKRTSRDLPEE